MYRFVRTAVIRNAADVPAAVQFGMEINGLLQKNYNVQVRAGMELFGEPTMHWYLDIESLEKLAELNTKLIQDRTYVGMLNKARELWMDGKMRDRVVLIP